MVESSLRTIVRARKDAKGRKLQLDAETERRLSSTIDEAERMAFYDEDETTDPLFIDNA